LLCSFLALAFACAHGAHRDPEASAKRLAVGQDYYSKHLVAAALVELDRALDLDPENPDAHYLMGILKMGQGVEHLELAERAACLRGAKAEAERADAMAKMHDAEQSFQLAIRFRPYFAEAYDGLAVIAIYTRDYDAALRYEQHAQENAVFAENPIAKANLGWAYYGKKDFVRAEKELRESVAKSPEFCVGRYRLGQVLLDQGDYAGAVEELAQIRIRRCPIQEAYRALGLARGRLRQPAEAKQAFVQCVELAPHSCLAEECRRYSGLMVRGEDER
jgi:tetratricopeptide (TPR) repeat protein